MCKCEGLEGGKYWGGNHVITISKIKKKVVINAW